MKVKDSSLLSIEGAVYLYDMKKQVSAVEAMRPYQIAYNMSMTGMTPEEIAYIYGFFTAGDLYYKVERDMWKVTDEPTGMMGNLMVFTDSYRIDECLEAFKNEKETRYDSTNN